MMNIFSTLNRYIFRSISSGLILSVLLFLTLDVLIGFIQQINAVGKGDFTVGNAVFYTLLTIPSKIYGMFPLSSVVGVMIGLGALAARSELVVMQSAGISRLKIAWITIMSLIVWLVPISIMGEYVVPTAIIKAESFRSSKVNKDTGLGVNTGVWIRDGNIIFNAQPIENNSKNDLNNIVMNNVTVYELDDKLQVIKVSKAKSATHYENSWELHGLEETKFIDSGVATKLIDKQIWESRIEPNILNIATTRPKNLSIRDIIKFKEFQADKNNTPLKFDIALWSKLSYPLLVIATGLTGLPFLFGLFRAGGFGQRLLIGVVLGIVLYLLKWTLLNVGEVFNIHPFIVTAFPSVVILFFVMWFLNLQQKKN
ncbi:MAG: LPS export ABC transporter permease LptG [Marinicellaceae bacterium]